VYADVLAGAPAAVSYRGAFSGPTDAWADGWSAVSSLGYLKPAETVSAPVITGQPEAVVSVFPGDAVTLAVSATGDAPLAYQWSKDGVAIAGANASMIELSAVEPTDAGSYTVTVSNAGGSVTSEASVVTVNFVLFEDWATSNGLSGADADLAADPDGDGIVNLFEYAFGGNPNGDSSGRLPAATEVDDAGTMYPALTYVRNKTAVGGFIDVAAATDLEFATPITLVVASVVDLGDGTERITVRTESPVGNDQAVFWATSVVIP
jgi:hypothetical protein